MAESFPFLLRFLTYDETSVDMLVCSRNGHQLREKEGVACEQNVHCQVVAFPNLIWFDEFVLGLCCPDGGIEEKSFGSFNNDFLRNYFQSTLTSEVFMNFMTLTSFVLDICRKVLLPVPESPNMIKFKYISQLYEPLNSNRRKYVAAFAFNSFSSILWKGDVV